MGDTLLNSWRPAVGLELGGGRHEFRGRDTQLLALGLMAFSHGSTRAYCRTGKREHSALFILYMR